MVKFHVTMNFNANIPATGGIEWGEGGNEITEEYKSDKGDSGVRNDNCVRCFCF